MRKLLIACAIMATSTAAFAMPAAVPQRYYDTLPQRWATLASAPGFCRTPIGAMSLVCAWPEDI